MIDVVGWYCDYITIYCYTWMGLEAEKRAGGALVIYICSCPFVLPVPKCTDLFTVTSEIRGKIPGGNQWGWGRECGNKAEGITSFPCLLEK